MGSGGSGAVGAGMFIFIFLMLCYFIPTVIAVLRKHKDTPAIAAINVLLGWSVVGWFASFVWSLSDPNGRGAQTVVINTTQHNVAAPATYAPPVVQPPTRSPLAASMADVTLADDRDTAFWDRITDRNDADQLEEYLIRFPAGRFAELARNKLKRLIGPPAEPSPSPTLGERQSGSAEAAGPTAPAQTSICVTCDTALDPDSRFCTRCGTVVAA